MFDSKILKDYKGYGKCIYMTNDVIDVVATLDMGPRIIRYGFVNGVNIINDDLDSFTRNTSEELQRYYGPEATYSTMGGHRLWISPEYYPETYFPDNKPVEYEIVENGVAFTQVPQIENGIQMKITVILDPDDTNVQVKHEITNISSRTREFAPWSLTVAAKDGIEIIPMNTGYMPYLPNANIVLWRYTDLRSKNIYLGKKYSTVIQPEKNSLKLGFNLEHGTIYYVVDDVVFIKNYYPNYPYGNYNDMGASFETYSCSKFTEIETLGEYKPVYPGDTVSHIEHWSLCKKPCEFDVQDEDSIENFINQL